MGVPERLKRQEYANVRVPNTRSTRVVLGHGGESLVVHSHHASHKRADVTEGVFGDPALVITGNVAPLHREIARLRFKSRIGMLGYGRIYAHDGGGMYINTHWLSFFRLAFPGCRLSINGQVSEGWWTLPSLAEFDSDRDFLVSVIGLPPEMTTEMFTEVILESMKKPLRPLGFVFASAEVVGLIPHPHLYEVTRERILEAVHHGIFDRQLNVHVRRTAGASVNEFEIEIVGRHRDIAVLPEQITRRVSDKTMKRTFLDIDLTYLETFPGFTCDTCGTGYSLHKLDCGHHMCYDCCVVMFNVCITDHRFPIRCGMCDEPLQLRFILEWFMSDEGTLERLVVSSYEAHFDVAQGEDFVRCITPDCVGFFVNSAPRYQMCTECDRVQCVVCATPSHGTIRCEDHVERFTIQAELQQMMESDRQHYKHCPMCWTAIFKDGGCLHVYCPRCQTHFCWVCLQVGSSPLAVHRHLVGNHFPSIAAEFEI
ncbi:hypothetical protein L596_020040 [Steinernema carpocapsae]|uniref:RING-type domain-containing protein n=1 Tax=Steinernema carpocapsae TaxID=34508 RepID=A0A4U5MT02_STECR|nr:hypothetical protein L596_020040 [Steinernema carpocapsae]